VQAAVAPEPPLPAGIPDTPAGHKLAWVLRAIEAGAKVDKAELEANFSPAFLAHVSAEQVTQVMAQLHGMQLVEATGDPTGMKLMGHATLGDRKLRVQLSLDEHQQIEGLLFAPDIGEKPTTWEAAEQALHAAAPHAQLLVAELAGDKCKARHAVEPKLELAIGSTMKLYVLLAVADRISSGKLTWETPIEIKDAWKSLPSGKTQDEPAGTKLAVRELADRMISISDNTATDHLLYTVGRKRVEAALRAAKHAKPSLDIPFLSTRELFLLKLSSTPEQVDTYIKSSSAKRRAILDKELANKQPTVDGVEAWTGARNIDQLEWFASSEDLCRVMATLHGRAGAKKLAPLLDVLSINPGIPVDKTQWPYVGYKGGSEPGVINLTWLLRRNDDKWFVVTLTANSDAGGTIPDEKLVGIASGVVELLAKEP
jgi:beta-lactamase class A